MSHQFIEDLESRQLLSVSAQGYAIPQARLDHAANAIRYLKHSKPQATLTATLQAANITEETKRYTFQVTYSGYTKAKWHLGDQRIVVTGPDGYRVVARLISAKNTRSPQVTATYVARAPQGGWVEENNGTYNVTLRGKLGNLGKRTIVPLGSFMVGIGANVAPSFTAGPDQTVAQDSGAQTVAAWATNISAGPQSEAGQTLGFEVTTDNAALFAVSPAIAPDGTLTYTPAAGISGSAVVSVVLKDDGGTAFGGVDTSAPASFTITVTPPEVTEPVVDPIQPAPEG